MLKLSLTKGSKEDSYKYEKTSEQKQNSGGTNRGSKPEVVMTLTTTIKRNGVLQRSGMVLSFLEIKTLQNLLMSSTLCSI